MQRNAAARRHRRRLAGSAIHARHPPSRHDLGLRDVLQIDNAEDVIGEPIEMRCDIGIATTGPPQAINPEARHFEKRNLLHLGRTRNVMDAEAGTEFLTVCNAVR